MQITDEHRTETAGHPHVHQEPATRALWHRPHALILDVALARTGTFSNTDAGNNAS